MFVEILSTVDNAQLKIRRFHYTPKLSFSIDKQTNVPVDYLDFYLIYEDTTIERIEVPVTPLYHVDELWVDLTHEIPDAKLFTRKVLESYSYRLIQPF